MSESMSSFFVQDVPLVQKSCLDASAQIWGADATSRPICTKGCSDCSAVEAFLGDPAREIFKIQANGQIRLHIQRRLDKDKYPKSCRSDYLGCTWETLYPAQLLPPPALVINKTIDKLSEAQSQRSMAKRLRDELQKAVEPEHPFEL